jgi:hypothetical protein
MHAHFEYVLQELTEVLEPILTIVHDHLIDVGDDLLEEDVTDLPLEDVALELFEIPTVHEQAHTALLLAHPAILVLVVGAPNEMRQELRPSVITTAFDFIIGDRCIGAPDVLFG